MNLEARRLQESVDGRVPWKRWGPYVSERAWGTVREDYSANGDAWRYFPFDQARSRAFRWNEDGLAGICDREQRICFAVSLWNGRDPFLKERLFGLSGIEGNHGEDVKEYYFYLDATPTYSYLKWLYKYPHAAFPYARLRDENARRGRDAPEFELIDAGVFDDNRYFDVFVEYAKAAPEDILVRITIENRAAGAAELHVLPTIWFRNCWSWNGAGTRPALAHAAAPAGAQAVALDEPMYGRRFLYCEGAPTLLFTDNDTNARRLFDAPNASPFVKDGIDDFVVRGRTGAVNPAGTGTKCSAQYRTSIPGGESAVFRLRFTNAATDAPFGPAFTDVFRDRLAEADEFYAGVIPAARSDDAKAVMRQAFAGLLWSKQYYHYDVRTWMDGDPAQPRPPAERKTGRNRDWRQLNNADVISMPDKWEYPWYAAWDLAFHTIPLALVDAAFAKQQLLLLLREWYMHPNGQLPAYEWNFSDVNPPVHAWAALRVFRIDRRVNGRGDRVFLARIFQKLLLNFTWWVNRADAEGNNIFEGGFLGLDNIGVFDRSRPLGPGRVLEQSDGTSWMAMFTLNMLAIAIELAAEDPVYEDIATKFLEHFLYIAHAMTDRGDKSLCLWHDEDGFFYDALRTGDGRIPLRIRSMVGLMPLFAVETLEADVLGRLKGFRRRMDWFLEHRPDLTGNVASMDARGAGERRLLSLVDADRLRRILSVMLDENEFLSPFGIRALSRVHRDRPFVLRLDGQDHVVDYEPGESTNALFGGNSNWRGPVWFPVNFLLIESIQKFHYYYGDAFTVECPAGSGRTMTLWDVATELSRRLSSIFLRGAGGRPVYGSNERFQNDPHWRDQILFYEYFHGDTGQGLGASHQTGWTAVVAKLLEQSGERPRHGDTP
jgi:Mannosylglycerate hydrolase MGH1-like glycoside hydrolase domain